jgi:hypothetical protein
LAILSGFLSRVAAGGLVVIFIGAVVVHLRDGWMMNWYGRKSGEGAEYFVMLLSLLILIILKGAGALSVDLWLVRKIANTRLLLQSASPGLSPVAVQFLVTLALRRPKLRKY